MRNTTGCTLLFVAVLCSGQASISAPASSTATYHSDAMNLDFRYPATFVNKAADDPSPGSKADNEATGKSCLSLPITAMDMRKSFNMIFLRRSDGACLGKEITASERGITVSGFLNYLLKEFGKPEMNSSTDYDIAGHKASAVSGAVKPEGVKPAGTVIYGSGSCLAVGKDLACFAFLSSDCKALVALSASSVKFTDSAEMPVIPATLPPACKSGI